MSELKTIHQLISAANPDAIAIKGSGYSGLSYAELLRLLEKTVLSLNSQKVGRNDRVAIVLPNGPEMATAFLAVASGATAAPLNPAYQKTEFDFYLSDLDASLLIVEENSQSPAVDAAKELNIPIMELRKDKEKYAGKFELLSVEKNDQPVEAPAFSNEEDIALILHTSGTTSRPKIVPLSQANICASARNIKATLSLTNQDRCLNVMPLFHIHGLIAAILSSVSAGGSVFCTPGFNALKFFSWMKESQPSWYTAVPTMHQTILSRSAKNNDIISQSPLRFIRSSSSSLPPQVMKQLEQVFSAPVIEAYAMTEASHQMTSNQLPPGQRKPGTVGMAAGPKVAIMDESGTILEQGSIGEIVIQGDNLTAGYDKNAKANAESFVNSWFRTGDQGVLDEGGFLSITGRLKEIINRGGEKISPREVDEVLLDHPAITQVLTFAVAHEKLGEEVAAAIVLNEGQSLDESEVRSFASERLANFKVPKQILFLDEIPKGATGKMQRIGLAKKLGLE